MNHITLGGIYYYLVNKFLKVTCVCTHKTYRQLQIPYNTNVDTLCVIFCVIILFYFYLKSLYYDPCCLCIPECSLGVLN